MAASTSANYSSSREYVDSQALYDWLKNQPDLTPAMPVAGPEGVAPPKGREGGAGGRPQYGPLGLGTLGEAVKEAPRVLTEGVGKIRSAATEAGLGFWQRVGRATIGGLEAVGFAGAPVGHVAGRLGEELTKATGELSDEVLTQRLERAKKYNPGEVGVYEAILATPAEQRGEAVYDAYRSGGELAIGAVPGYSKAFKVISRLAERIGVAEDVARPAGQVPTETPLSTAADVAGREGRATRGYAEGAQLLERQTTPMRPELPPQPTAIMVDEFNRVVDVPVRSSEELAVARREAMRATHRTPLEAEGRLAPEPAAAPAGPEAAGELSSAGEQAMKRAEAALAKDLEPRVQRLEDALAKAPEEPTAPGRAEGAIRMEVEPRPEPGSKEANALAEEQAQVRQEFEDFKSSRAAQPAAAETAPAAGAALPRPGEAGFATAGTLVRMALGALAGGATGETPEEQIRNGLIGAGVGAALSRRTATHLAAALKDERGGVDITKIFRRRPTGELITPRVQAGEQYQPNYERIAAEGDLRRLMVNVHRQFAEQITAAQRIPTTHRETTFEAARMIEKGEVSVQSILDNEKVDLDKLPSWSKAARDINVAVANEAYDIGTRMLAGEVFPPGELRRALAVSGEIAERTRTAQTRFGQTLSAQKISAQLPSEQLVRPRVDAMRLNRMANEIAPGVDDMELAALVVKAGDPQHIIRQSRFLAVMPRAILEATMFSLLGGATMAKNFLSLMLVMPVSIGVRGLSRFMPRWGDQAPGVMAGEATQMMIGWWEGVTEQLRMLREWDRPAWRAQLEAAGGRFHEGIHTPVITAQNFGMDAKSTPGQLVDYAGRGLRLPMDILNGTDAFGKAINGRMMHRVEAFRQATLEGHEGAAFTRTVDDLLNDPSKLSSEARFRIESFKEEQTFTKDLEGRVGQALQRGPIDPWANLLWKNTVSMFTRTPVRIAEYSLAHTPLMNVLAKQSRSDFLAGGTHRQVAQAKLAMGAGIIGLFGYMENLGMITGSAPEDHDLKRVYEANGWKEKSFWDPITDQWRSYAGLEPAATWIAIGADISFTIRHMPDPDALKLFSAGVLATLQNLEADRFVMQLSDMIHVIKSPTKQAMVQRGLEYVGERLVRIIPGAQLADNAALREIEGVVDPAKRRITRSGAIDNPVLREFDAVLQYYRSRIPGLSSARDAEGAYKVRPWRNSFTGEIDVTENFPFTSFGGRAPKYDPVFDEIIRLNGAGLKELPDYIGAREVADFGLVPVQQKPGVQLTPAQADRWVVLMTQEVKNSRGETYYQALRATIASPQYQRYDDRPVVQAERLRALEGQYKELARRALFREYPLLAKQFRAEQIEERLQSAPADRRDQLRETMRNAAGIGQGAPAF